LDCIVLYWIVYWIVLHCIGLCIGSYCIVLYCIGLCIGLYCIVLYCIGLCIGLYCIVSISWVHVWWYTTLLQTKRDGPVLITFLLKILLIRCIVCSIYDIITHNCYHSINDLLSLFLSLSIFLECMFDDTLRCSDECWTHFYLRYYYCMFNIWHYHTQHNTIAITVLTIFSLFLSLSIFLECMFDDTLHCSDECWSHFYLRYYCMFNIWHYHTQHNTIAITVLTIFSLSFSAYLFFLNACLMIHYVAPNKARRFVKVFWPVLITFLLTILIVRYVAQFRVVIDALRAAYPKDAPLTLQEIGIYPTDKALSWYLFGTAGA